MIECYIEGKNLVNGVPKVFDISEGAVFAENHNETLDSGTIIIPHLSDKIEIEPFDVVVISGDNINNKRLCVESYNCIQTSLKPAIYRYEITLMSETKILEGFLCPNLSIRKVIGQTRSVKYYLQQYIDEYGPKILVSGNYVNKFTLSDDVLLRFNNVECPEMQWNQPTLRDVLNDLMMVDDCLVILRNNIIYLLDISVEGTEITDEQKEGINYITESQSSTDYVSELKMNIVNAANNSIPKGPYHTITDLNLPFDQNMVVENIGFRNDDSYLLTTENMRLQTQYPIWKLFFCEINFKVDATITYTRESEGPYYPEHTINTTLDAGMILKDSYVDYIPEYGEWQTKDVYYGAWSLSDVALSNQYRNTCLYFVRGQKNIENFNTKVENQFLFIHNTLSVFDLILNNPECEQTLEANAIEYFNNNKPVYDAVYKSVSASTTLSYKTATFKVSYEPIDECVVRISKTPFQRHTRYIVDNQTNSYIDVNRQGLLEYMKAKRLGNKLALINGRYEVAESNIPQLTNKINDKIIFRKEISVYNDHIDVNYQATENYILRDYFTGVKSKLRSWRVVGGSEALLRADLIKFYVNDNIETVDTEDAYIPSWNNVNAYLLAFKYCAIQFNTEFDGIRPKKPKYNGTEINVDAIFTEFTRYVMGNSVIFTIRMKDNRYFSNYVSNYSGTDSRVEQKGIGYTDDNGEIIGGTIYFYDEADSPEYIDANNAVTRAIKPYCKINDEYSAKIPFTIHKDNAEITQISIQFEINDEANDIILGKIF